MRIVLLYHFYEQFLRSIYAEPGVAGLPYNEQLERIVNSHFGDACSFYRHLQKQGHEPFLVIPNCREIQTAWALEAGFEPGKEWMTAIPAEQIRRIQPDIVYTSGLFPFYGDFFRTIRPYCRHIVSWIACPFPETLDFTDVSMVFTGSPSFRQYFLRRGLKSVIVPAAFDGDIVAAMPAETPDIPFSFVGGVSTSHVERFMVLKGLVEATQLQLWGYGIETGGIKERLKRLLKFGTLSNPLQSRYRGEAWGLDMYRVLRRSRITFNLHIDVAGDWCGNMRMFEATGSGTLLLTDRKKNLPELFDPEREVVPYDSLDDAIDKVNYYLAHEEERQIIASAGQARTLRDYSFARRVENIVKALQSELTL